MNEGTRRKRRTTVLLWLAIGVTALFIACVACALVGLLTGEPDAQVARTQSEPTVIMRTATAEPALPTTFTATAVAPSPAPPTEVATAETSAPVQLSPASPTEAAVPDPALDRQPVQVVRVVDGDTLRVLLNGEEATVRLIGVDTPESVHPQQPVECFGREASAKTRELADGQPVQLAADPTQDSVDRFGRLLRYVYLPDGTLLNQELIAQGYAFEYTFNVPYRYQAEFRQAEQSARAEQRGLWAPETCNGEQRPVE